MRMGMAHERAIHVEQGDTAEISMDDAQCRRHGRYTVFNRDQVTKVHDCWIMSVPGASLLWSQGRGLWEKVIHD